MFDAFFSDQAKHLAAWSIAIKNKNRIKSSKLMRTAQKMEQLKRDFSRVQNGRLVTAGWVQVPSPAWPLVAKYKEKSIKMDDTKGEVIAGLQDLIKDRKSFITPDGDNEIWEKDIMILEKVIELIK